MLCGEVAPSKKNSVGANLCLSASAVSLGGLSHAVPCPGMPSFFQSALGKLVCAGRAHPEISGRAGRSVLMQNSCGWHRGSVRSGDEEHQREV